MKKSSEQSLNRTETFCGYKAHVSLYSETELITSVQVPGCNRYDGHELPVLVEKDLAQGIPVQIASADRGYDDSDNQYPLTSKRSSRLSG